MKRKSKRWQKLVDGGLKWLAEHQNSDGGWGDTVLSISNISTTMLAHAVFRVSVAAEWSVVIQSSAAYIAKAGGVEAVIKRYGQDRTFSVPILTHCALAGIVEWKNVIPLPFELACVPHRLYAAVRMPVVSYALARVDCDRASDLQTSGSLESCDAIYSPESHRARLCAC